jgi:hypothetical protein
MLSRFAVSGHVPGGASRLLMAAQIDRIEDVITFSDHRYTDGVVYSRIGFSRVSELPPSYSYWRGGLCYHKSELQRKHLWSESGGITDETEYELASRLGYSRIYDMGKTKWLFKKIPPS